ncbi:MAG TPA: hypothetical protein VMH35_11000 [Streptosporangiaceae bacterium]|nr:hypothetical protein [Streptosporangiaceae bacterium]
MLLAFGTAAGASSTAGASTAAARGRQAAAARTLLQHLSVGQHSADQRVPGHSARSGACPR